MIFQNHKDGTQVAMGVDPIPTIRELTEALHKVLGAVSTISKAMHNLSEALLNGEAGPNEAIYSVHGLSHSLEALINTFMKASPVYTYNPKVAQDWIHREAMDYMDIVLDPLIGQIQKEVDQANAMSPESERAEDINTKVSELEAMVAKAIADQRSTMRQVADSLDRARQTPKTLDSSPVDPTQAEPLVGSPESMPGEIKGRLRSKRPNKRNSRN